MELKPMLAHKYESYADRVTYPAYIQPKLDGIRCLAVIKDGKATLWTRTNKPITSAPHIIEQLESAAGGVDITLDGELYNEKYKANFEKLVSLVRQQEPDADHHEIEYHIYDIYADGTPFWHRNSKLRHLPKRPNLITLQGTLVADELELVRIFDHWVAEGYEGAMFRAKDGMYEHKRSANLLKLKKFQDAEFEITGAEEGKGKLLGHLGAFICKTAQGNEFKVKMTGEFHRLQEYLSNKEIYIGKMLTVKYQGISNKNKVPRFPIGVSVRDYE